MGGQAEFEDATQMQSAQVVRGQAAPGLIQGWWGVFLLYLLVLRGLAVIHCDTN